MGNDTLDKFDNLANEAAAELDQEYANAAKSRIKESLKIIADSEKVTANLRQSHDVLMADIKTGRWEAYGYGSKSTKRYVTTRDRDGEF